MTGNPSIIELGHWLQTPPGRYLLGWEQARLDAAVADLFGFHALQVGLPSVDALRNNRMPNRWLATGGEPLPLPAPIAQIGGDDPGVWPARAAALHCEPEMLPFADQSLDLVVLPHTLELALDPHQSLAEVARVLRPEGRVVICGLNPMSLWGMRQSGGRFCQALSRHERTLYLPRAGDFIGYWRLRDWLRLLGLEIQRGELGCYRPPLSSQRWLDRFTWMERVGQRWWPVLGAVYFVVAVKRVRGMRLVGLVPQHRAAGQAAPAAVANRQAR